MSNQLPSRTIEFFRNILDLSIDTYGIDCDLYIPTNLTAQEGNDMYTAPADITYKHYERQKVWIDWATKDLVKLRKLGLVAEDELPIIAHFKNFPEVLLGSYIQISSNYVPDSYDTDQFEIVNPLIQSMHDAEVYKAFKIAPRRAKV